jgi:Tfp pilus assembly pilus retraction ATPase PilT
MATRLAIREKQLETWTAIIQECRNSGMKTKDWLAENNISKDQYYYRYSFY